MTRELGAAYGHAAFINITSFNTGHAEPPRSALIPPQTPFRLRSFYAQMQRALVPTPCKT